MIALSATKSTNMSKNMVFALILLAKIVLKAFDLELGRYILETRAHHRAPKFVADGADHGEPGGTGEMSHVGCSTVLG
jgi:hypothetical protein